MTNPIALFGDTLPWVTLATLGFYLLTIVYLVFTAVLYFHWQQYSINTSISKTTALLYLCSTLPLIVILGVSTWLL